jgi:CTP synthase (UTP-ammonia lyase)
VGGSLRIGIVGDYDPDRLSHAATDAALDHAARARAVAVERTWLPTPSLEGSADVVRARLRPYHALWCAPGSPYRSMDGALAAIRAAREGGWPYVGT